MVQQLSHFLFVETKPLLKMKYLATKFQILEIPSLHHIFKTYQLQFVCVCVC